MKFLQKQFAIPAKFIYQQGESLDTQVGEKLTLEQLIQDLEEINNERHKLISRVTREGVESLETDQERSLLQSQPMTREQLDFLRDANLTEEQIMFLASKVMNREGRQILGAKLEPFRNQEKQEFDGVIKDLLETIRTRYQKEGRTISLLPTKAYHEDSTQIGNRSYSRKSNVILIEEDTNQDGQIDITREIYIQANRNSRQIFLSRKGGISTGNNYMSYEDSVIGGYYGDDTRASQVKRTYFYGELDNFFQ